jgi:hypothetical protein
MMELTMKEQLQKNIDKSREKIREITSTVDNKSEKLSADTKQLWQHAKVRLSEINEKLGEASGHLASKKDDAALQAHLAAMEAHDKWQNISKSFDKFEQLTHKATHQVTHQAKAGLEHTALKSHLAKMDAGDFMETTGNNIVHNFSVSRNKIEKTTVDSVKAMEGYFHQIAKKFNHNS